MSDSRKVTDPAATNALEFSLSTKQSVLPEGSQLLPTYYAPETDCVCYDYKQQDLKFLDRKSHQQTSSLPYPNHIKAVQAVCMVSDKLMLIVYEKKPIEEKKAEAKEKEKEKETVLPKRIFYIQSCTLNHEGNFEPQGEPAELAQNYTGRNFRISQMDVSPDKKNILFVVEVDIDAFSVLFYNLSQKTIFYGARAHSASFITSTHYAVATHQKIDVRTAKNLVGTLLRGVFLYFRVSPNAKYIFTISPFDSKHSNEPACRIFDLTKNPPIIVAEFNATRLDRTANWVSDNILLVPGFSPGEVIIFDGDRQKVTSVLPNWDGNLTDLTEDDKKTISRPGIEGSKVHLNQLISCSLSGNRVDAQMRADVVRNKKLYSVPLLITKTISFSPSLSLQQQAERFIMEALRLRLPVSDLISLIFAYTDNFLAVAQLEKSIRYETDRFNEEKAFIKLSDQKHEYRMTLNMSAAKIAWDKLEKIITNSKMSLETVVKDLQNKNLKMFSKSEASLQKKFEEFSIQYHFLSSLQSAIMDKPEEKSFSDCINNEMKHMDEKMSSSLSPEVKKLLLVDFKKADEQMGLTNQASMSSKKRF